MVELRHVQSLLKLPDTYIRLRRQGDVMTAEIGPGQNYQFNGTYVSEQPHAAKLVIENFDFDGTQLPAGTDSFYRAFIDDVVQDGQGVRIAGGLGAQMFNGHPSKGHNYGGVPFSGYAARIIENPISNDVEGLDPNFF